MPSASTLYEAARRSAGRPREDRLSGERVERRLAAILAADVAGYSRLMGRDEAGTLARLNALRRELIDPKVAEHKGRIVKTTGDGLLIEFPSIVEAVACAIAVQGAMAERNADMPEERRIEFRVGINLGDVIVEDGDIHGDGVNIAARLEGLAEPGGICVSAIVHDQVHGRLDCVFEDTGEQTLKNIVRPIRVYRIALTGLAPAMLGTLSRSAGEGLGGASLPLSRTAGEGGGGRSATPGQGDSSGLPLPDKPSIAVLPFQNMSGDPEQDYFVDGMVEEIITALSRIRWLFVIARNSSFTYKGQAVDVKRVGRELGVRYVLEGSVRKGGGQVRITAQLIDAATGAHLWADRFDGAFKDVFELQDRVASSVAGIIEPALQAAETARSAGRSTGDLTAYDLYLRANAMVRVSAKRIPEAMGLLERAIERDPRYGPALAYAAVCCFRLHDDGVSEDPDVDRAKGIEFARRALEVAGDDPSILANAALALAYFGEDIGAMLALVERGLTLNPHYARGWFISGVLRYWAGQLDLAIEHSEASMRLSPRASVGTSLFVIGAALFLSRRFGEAVPKLLLSMQEDPSFPYPYYYLAAWYAHMGRLDDAREIVTRLRAITEVAIPQASYLWNADHRELLLSGLRLATGEADTTGKTGGSG
jgi:adenylate cyclase